jgi:hypothetical protein
MPNTIILRGNPAAIREDRCNEAFTPGHLIEFNANDRLQKHSTSGGWAARMFALEADYIGNGISTAYASGDRVVYADCVPGNIVYAFLASGQNVARGDYLMSNGAGLLTARTSTNIGVAQADEDVNATSGSGTGGVRIRARVI